MLSQDSITFGKYKGKDIKELLNDRKYCKWLCEQEWINNNTYLLNKIKEYSPATMFVNVKTTEKPNADILTNEFINTYPPFNMIKPEDTCSLPLTDTEKICYEFYYKAVMAILHKIQNRIQLCETNPYDIKFPTTYLQKFESASGLKREDFKTFLYNYDLPGIATIIEKVREQGGLTFNQVNSFKIAKERSVKQEKYWEDILVNIHGRDSIKIQFKYENCIFDMICIPTNTIYECKLGLKDFNEEQYKKYKKILGTYNIIYLIGTDCWIDMQKRYIKTIDLDKYTEYLQKIPKRKSITFMDSIIRDFNIILVNNISDEVRQLDVSN